MMRDTYSPPPRGGEYFLVLIILFALGASMPFQAKPPLPTGLVIDHVDFQHLSGDTGHPERPERLTAIRDGLEQAGLLKSLFRIEPRRVTERELELVHKPSYIELVRRELSGFEGLKELSTGDTLASPESLQTAEFAAGGVLNAVEAVMAGKVKNAFCVVRPPGHHATPDRGMGFCIFNNVAIAARYAQKKYGIGKALVVDWDVHHGNGTQDIFYRDGSVFYFSTHQSPWYPGTGAADETGEGAGAGTTMNAPFQAGSGRREILGAFQDRLLPAIRDFKPDVTLISAGFDSRLGDPLRQFTLSDTDFADLTKLMLA